MKTSLLLVTITLATASGVYAGPGPAYWMHAQPAAHPAVATSPINTPSAGKAAADKTGPRPYERGVKPAMPAATAACCRQS